VSGIERANRREAPVAQPREVYLTVGRLRERLVEIEAAFPGENVNEWAVGAGTPTSFQLGSGDVVHVNLPHLRCVEVRLLEL